MRVCVQGGKEGERIRGKEIRLTDRQTGRGRDFVGRSFEGIDGHCGAENNGDRVAAFGVFPPLLGLPTFFLGSP